jgi:acetyl-CoA carboxylase carboxyl transferase subunit beta
MSTDGTRWFERKKDFVTQPKAAPGGADVSPDLFTRCPECGEWLFQEALAARQQVCPSCAHHMPIGAAERIAALCDAGSVVFHDENLMSKDPLGFVDSKPYPKRIQDARRKSGLNDAFRACSATIGGISVELGVFDFAFLGGSMGSVVGEQITRLYERARERKVPAIVVSASGGARMQEGVLSLMQMAKTCAALARLRDEANMPYISVLTNPTTGGVAASFAMLGDLILAEPKALIGFAGARVIKQTIGEDLPEGFQTSEYLLAHGMVDQIVSRLEMRDTLIRVLGLLLHLPPAGAQEILAR